MVFGSGFASTADNVSRSKEYTLCTSVISGIIMCKIAYGLTGFASRLACRAYGKLSSRERLEWSNRGFSTFHAIFAAFASLYLLVVSDQFKEDSQDDLVINRTSTVSEMILGVSIGYFLSDLGMILWHFPALGGLEYVLHHGLSSFSIFLSVISGQSQIYILMVLFSEATTPFVNLRWYLDVSGLKSSRMYILNGIALFLGWLVVRVLLFIFFFAHMFIHFDQVKLVFPLGFYSLLTIPPILAAMNLLWFWKITKGLIKTLSKAKRSQ